MGSEYSGMVTRTIPSGAIFQALRIRRQSLK
jgi:hypothetical protein